MLIQAPDELLEKNKGDDNRTSTEQVTEQLSAQVTEQAKILISVIAHEQLTLKQLMERVGLKHRPTFMENYLNPAIQNGFVRVLYPETPNHPRQKYLLTVKGMTL